MICWLIQWSATGNKADKALRDLGRDIVEALLGKHGVELQGAIRHAEIRQQEHGIDVLVRILDEDSAHVFLIEDKTHASAHGNQLQRYRDLVTEGHTSLGEVLEHWPLYLKTGNQSLAEDADIARAGYKVFCRRDLLAVLNGYQGTHPIVTDFRDHIQGFEDDFSSFGNWRQGDRREKWTWAGWEGFYRRLEEELETQDRHNMGWGYVPTPSGGFLGFWWSEVDVGRQTEFYLQLEVVPGSSERQKLCFKVAPWEEDADKCAQRFYDMLRGVSGGELIERPRKFGRRGSGTMTVGWWRGNGWSLVSAEGLTSIKLSTTCGKHHGWSERDARCGSGRTDKKKSRSVVNGAERSPIFGRMKRSDSYASRPLQGGNDG